MRVEWEDGEYAKVHNEALEILINASWNTRRDDEGENLLKEAIEKFKTTFLRRDHLPFLDWCQLIGKTKESYKHRPKRIQSIES